MGRRPARYIRCSAAACDARLSLEVTDFQAWKGAREAVLTYRPTTSAPPIRFAVSLMGLTAAFEAARMEGDHDR